MSERREQIAVVGAGLMGASIAVHDDAAAEPVVG